MPSSALQLELDDTRVELSEETVAFEIQLRLPCDDPYVKYVTRFSGIARLDDPELDEPVSICELEGHRIDLRSAVREGIDASELLESLSAELSDLDQALLRRDGSGRLKQSIGPHAVGKTCNLVYIDRIKVHPQARGLGIGRRMLRHVARVIDMPDRLLALKAMPLAEAFEQDREQLDRDSRKPRLRRFYAELGFTALEQDFMVADRVY